MIMWRTYCEIETMVFCKSLKLFAVKWISCSGIPCLAKIDLRCEITIEIGGLECAAGHVECNTNGESKW